MTTPAPARRPAPPREGEEVPGTRHDPVIVAGKCTSTAFIDGQMRTCERTGSHNTRSGERQHHGGGRRWETVGNNIPATVVKTCPTDCVCRGDGRAWS